MKDLKTIVYVGLDKKYWKNIQYDFNEIYGNKHEFIYIHYEITEDTLYFDLYKRFLDKKIDIVFLDYNTHEETVLKLAKLLRNDNFAADITVIGLLAFNQTKGFLIKRSSKAGVLINHIKLSDTYDTVYDAYTFHKTDNIVKPPFFLARFPQGKTFPVKESVRLNYLTKTEISFETNRPLKKDTVLDLYSYIPEDVIPSTQYKVKEVTSYGHYYNYFHCATLEYLFIDMLPEPDKKMDPMQKATYQDNVNNRKKAIVKAKKDLNMWFRDRLKYSDAKHLKILIIDNKMSIYQQAGKALNEYSYFFRIHSHLLDIENELDRYRPSIITVQYESPHPPPPVDEDDKKAKANKDEKVEEIIVNDIGFITKLVECVQKIKEYNPIIIIFNNPEMTSQKLQTVLKYPKIINNQMSFSFDALLSMSNLFENKNKFFDPSTIEEKAYINKNDELSGAHILFDINIIAMSETIIYFKCEDEIPDHSILELDNPAKCFITVVTLNSAEQSMYDGGYKGLIHTLDQENKAKLRKYIISAKK